MQVAQIEAAEYAREYATRIAELQQVDHALFEIMHLHHNGTLIPVRIELRIIEYEGAAGGAHHCPRYHRPAPPGRQLRQSQKLGAIGRLAGGIAHDFNNFLTVTNGFSALILRTTAPNDPSYHGLELIAETGERAAGLVRKLLAFSRQQPVEMQVMNLGQVLNDMQTMLQRLIGEDVALRLVEAPGLGNIRADAGQMEQVVVNLAVNARDAMPTGGTLTISASNAELDAGFVALRPSLKAGRYVRLSVEDTGVGMSPEVQQHLFAPFFTTKGKEKGTGLGLPIVYGIVTQGAGQIEVESQLGQGTRVDVYLPVVEEVVKAAWSRAALGIPLGGDETLLVVEDEEGVRGLVVQGCESWATWCWRRPMPPRRWRCAPPVTRPSTCCSPTSSCPA
jgi:signal transduction histidine kinase